MSPSALLLNWSPEKQISAPILKDSERALPALIYPANQWSVGSLMTAYPRSLGSLAFSLCSAKKFFNNARHSSSRMPPRTGQE